MRSLRPFLLAGLFATAVAIPVAVPAFAQAVPARSTYSQCSKAPTAEEAAQGHTAYTFGKEKYDKGRLDEAITFFKDAYERDCQNHDYLIIISRAYERQPNLPEAILALETYVQRSPNAPDLDKHRANIDSMKQRAKASAPPTAPTTQPTTTPTTQPTTAPTSPPPNEQEHTIYPWIVTGIGVAALGGGIVMLVLDPGVPAGCHGDTGQCDNFFDNGDTNINSPTGKDANGNPVVCKALPSASGCSKSAFNTDRQNKAGSSVSLSKAGPITMVAGGVIIAGGLIWHFVEPTGPKKESAFQNLQIAPVVIPGYSGMAMGARF